MNMEDYLGYAFTFGFAIGGLIVFAVLGWAIRQEERAPGYRPKAGGPDQPLKNPPNQGSAGNR